MKHFSKSLPPYVYVHKYTNDDSMSYPYNVLIWGCIIVNCIFQFSKKLVNNLYLIHFDKTNTMYAHAVSY